MWVLINALCKPSLEAPGDQNFSGRKSSNLNGYISVITDIDEKWFVVFEQTINHLSFDYIRLLKLEYYFSCLASFFLLLLFFVCRCLLLNRQSTVLKV